MAVLSQTEKITFLMSPGKGTYLERKTRLYYPGTTCGDNVKAREPGHVERRGRHGNNLQKSGPGY
jgi:hypothetical protein